MEAATLTCELRDRDCNISIQTYVIIQIHGLTNYKEAKTYRHLKKPTWKGTSQQVFIRVYRLEMQSVMLVFST